jgi:hypothetical protein
MIKFLTNPSILEEHIALLSTSCYQCDRDIDIGDDCYVDMSEGPEERRTKTYCERCYDEALSQQGC